MGDSNREYGRFYPVAKAVVGPVANFFWRLNTTGLHNVPDVGPAIFCPNHISFFDSLVLPVVLPRRISYVGKAEYMDSWKTKYIFPAVGMVPIDRGGGDKSAAALDTAARILERGEFFGIYPEGTRSRNGKLHRGHTGPARLALRTGAPIIPVGLSGTDHIQVPDSSVPKPFRSCQVNIGAPIDVSRYRDRMDDRMVLRQIIDEVMFEIQALSGQEYVDEYANKRTTESSAPASPVEAETPAMPEVDLTTVYTGAPASWPEPGASTRELVSVGAPGGDADDEVIDVRQSSADVLAQWWS